MPVIIGNSDTTAVRDISYPEVEAKLSISANVNKYKRFMAEFMSRRQKDLYSNMPTKQIYYSNDDVNKWFAATGIDKKIIKNGIKQTYYAKVANFNPSYAKDDSTIAILCALRYFIKAKNEQMKQVVLVHFAFSGKFYPSVFYKSFRYPPAEHIMEYVANNMLTSKYDIARTGNVIGAVKSVTETWCETYMDKLMSFTDEDITYLVQQLHNRIDSFIHNIAVLYYKAHDDKNAFITFDSDNVSEDDYHLADNDSFKINLIVENAMRELTAKNIDLINIQRSSNDMVKFTELKAIIDTLVSNNDNIPLIREYCMLMVSLFFTEGKGKDVKEISFISYSIRPVPNSKNPYIIRKKELMDQILTNNSENFTRRRSRAATESAYYRAFNAYISLIIQKANK